MAKTILVAPLNWGLGHATRCIPIIYALKDFGFKPLIASDGMALALLRKEFPEETHLELPSYGIRYPKKGADLKLRLLKQLPRIRKTVKEEQQLVNYWVDTHKLSGIISDNRFGVYSCKVPSVYLTHQLKVLSGNTTWFSTKMHQQIINRFSECWVPDFKDQPNLSGALGHPEKNDQTTKYIGPLSRFEIRTSKPLIDILLLLSGPEPQRTMLQETLIAQFKNDSRNLLLVEGRVESSQTITNQGHLTVYNFMTSSELEQAISTSQLVIARSGYSTVMDLSKLQKKAFFIPTPGQFEQEYLARHLEDSGQAPFCKQSVFTLDELNRIENYKGLSCEESKPDFEKLFHLFEGK